MWGQRCEEPLIAEPSAPLSYRLGAFDPPEALFYPEVADGYDSVRSERWPDAMADQEA